MPAAFVLVVLAAALSPESHADQTPQPAASARSAAPAAEVASAVSELARKIEKLGGTLSASVVDIESGTVLGEHNSHEPLNPASNAKLLTAGMVLEQLGPEHRFVAGLTGELNDRRVEELTLRGNWDPSLDAAALRGLVRQLRVRGVESVNHVLVDQARFSGSFTPPAFEQQPAEWAPFRAPVAPTSYERNTVTVWVTPGSEPQDVAKLNVDPLGFLELSGSVKTSSDSESEKIGLTLTPGSTLKAKLGGSIPVGSGPVPAIRRVEDPSLLAGYALRALLEEQGISVKGEVRPGSKARQSLLASRPSPSVGELLARLGKDSDNFTAEMLFLAASASSDGEASFGQAQSGALAHAKLRGIPDGEWLVQNGSGLFQANKASANAVATLLRNEARSSRTGPEYVAHLAIGGVDGTLKKRFKPLAKSRSVRAKTGTLAASVALSGYVLGSDGRPLLAFSFITGSVKGKTGQARDAIDDAVLALAR